MVMAKEIYIIRKPFFAEDISLRNIVNGYRKYGYVRSILIEYNGKKYIAPEFMESAVKDLVKESCGGDSERIKRRIGSMSTTFDESMEHVYAIEYDADFDVDKLVRAYRDTVDMIVDKSRKIFDEVRELTGKMVMRESEESSMVYALINAPVAVDIRNTSSDVVDYDHHEVDIRDLYEDISKIMENPSAYINKNEIAIGPATLKAYVDCEIESVYAYSIRFEYMYIPEFNTNSCKVKEFAACKAIYENVGKVFNSSAAVFAIEKLARGEVTKRGFLKMIDPRERGDYC